MTVHRPILRYFGGKWRLAPWILDHFPQHRIYVEAFGGGASVLLQKDRCYGEVYNDLDKEVVNVFRVMQRSPRRLRRLLEATPFAREEMELAYRRVKCPVENARRTIVRSFMGFSADSVTRASRTGFRNNSNKSGTNPAHDWARWPGHIQAFHERLSGVIVECRDAWEVMESQDSPETLHYVDPPYPHSTRSGGYSSCHGYRHEMADEDHRRLADRLTGLNGMVVVSGYPHPIYDGLGWCRKTFMTSTMGSGGKTADRMECIWLNPACSGRLLQMDFDGLASRPAPPPPASPASPG